MIKENKLLDMIINSFSNLKIDYKKKYQTNIKILKEFEKRISNNEIYNLEKLLKLMFRNFSEGFDNIMNQNEDIFSKLFLIKDLINCSNLGTENDLIFDNKNFLNEIKNSDNFINDRMFKMKSIVDNLKDDFNIFTRKSGILNSNLVNNINKLSHEQETLSKLIRKFY